MTQETIIFLLFVLFLIVVISTFVRGHKSLFLYNFDKHFDKYCYITFEIPSIGGKKEFCVPAQEYQMVAKGDSVVLILQGTRYIGFEKQ